MPTLTFPLTADGPICDVVVRVSGPRESALRAAGQGVPQPVFVKALIDTGASCTAIDPSVVERLRLSPTGTTQMHSASTGKQTQSVNEFDIGLAVVQDSQLIHVRRSLQVVECELAAFSTLRIGVLIGCDLLADGVLIFNGPGGTVTLAF